MDVWGLRTDVSETNTSCFIKGHLFLCLGESHQTLFKRSPNHHQVPDIPDIPLDGKHKWDLGSNLHQHQIRI